MHKRSVSTESATPAPKRTISYEVVHPRFERQLVFDIPFRDEIDRIKVDEEHTSMAALAELFEAEDTILLFKSRFVPSDCIAWRLVVGRGPLDFHEPRHYALPAPADMTVATFRKLYGPENTPMSFAVEHLSDEKHVKQRKAYATTAPLHVAYRKSLGKETRCTFYSTLSHGHNISKRAVNWAGIVIELSIPRGMFVPDKDCITKEKLCVSKYMSLRRLATILEISHREMSGFVDIEIDVPAINSKYRFTSASDSIVKCTNQLPAQFGDPISGRCVDDIGIEELFWSMPPPSKSTARRLMVSVNVSRYEKMMIDNCTAHYARLVVYHSPVRSGEQHHSLYTVPSFWNIDTMKTLVRERMGISAAEWYCTHFLYTLLSITRNLSAPSLIDDTERFGADKNMRIYTARTMCLKRDMEVGELTLLTFTLYRKHKVWDDETNEIQRTVSNIHSGALVPLRDVTIGEFHRALPQHPLGAVLIPPHGYRTILLDGDTGLDFTQVVEAGLHNDVLLHQMFHQPTAHVDSGRHRDKHFCVLHQRHTKPFDEQRMQQYLARTV